jgi:hypothetical protein
LDCIFGYFTPIHILRNCFLQVHFNILVFVVVCFESKILSVLSPCMLHAYSLTIPNISKSQHHLKLQWNSEHQSLGFCWISWNYCFMRECSLVLWTINLLIHIVNQASTVCGLTFHSVCVFTYFWSV